MDIDEIRKIKGQFQAGQWPQFLEMVEIYGLRGWNGQSVNFNFPIVAIVGENGTGKSTLLKAAVACYESKDKKKTYYPSSFFVETHWDRIQGVILNYRIKLGNDTRTFRISKPSARWGFPERRYERPVFLFDVSRTLPLDASAGYAKIARLAASEISTTLVQEEFRGWLCYVLGRDYKNARFAFSDADKKRDVGLLEREFGEISQFHQGAGEDTTLDLFRALQEVPNYSLLVIDEVEASLHPKAQRRLMRFLLWLCRQRKMQIIVSTHSPYILEELPLEARVLLLPGPSGLNVVYGVTPEFALSRIDESVHPDLIVFVEDREAGIWLREILAVDPNSSELLTRIATTPVGPANVVHMLGRLGKEKRLPYKSLAVIDGDNIDKNCVALPGKDAPELVVFSGLKEKQWQDLPSRFGVGAGTLFGALEDAMLSPEHHNWTKLVGDKVLKSAQSVWEILCNQWCKLCLDKNDYERIYQSIVDAMVVDES